MARARSDSAPRAREGAVLRDRHAVVTGGGRGIGAAIADELSRLGADVTILGRTVDDLEAHAATLRARYGGRVAALGCDVTDAESVASAFAAARERYGAPSILVNNAGAGASARFTETTREVWERMLLVNLTAHYLCISQVLPAMIEARHGRIVNIASTAGLKGYPRIAPYCAAKHGVIGLTRSLAVETAKLGITVNAVCPGYTETALADATIETLASNLGKSRDEARAMITRTIPRGTLIKPEEVADAVAWLCAPAAAAVTGQAIVVAGGEVM